MKGLRVKMESHLAKEFLNGLLDESLLSKFAEQVASGFSLSKNKKSSLSR